MVLRALKVIHAMGLRGFLGRLRSASAIRTRAAEPHDLEPMPAPVALSEVQLRVGVMVHVFYPDLIEEFARALGRIPLPFTLLVSVMDDAAERTARHRFGMLTNLHAMVIRQVENRGRDIAPFLVTFRDEILALDIIGHIHTKKSLYTGSEQEQWRGYLIDSLLGTPERIAWILGVFQAEPRLGMVYPESYQSVPLWAHTWLSNGPACDALAGLLGIALDRQRYIDFPAGSMFWARVDALRPLYGLNLQLDAFPTEQGQVDGTLQHAVERMFGIITRHQGFRLGILPANGDLALESEGERNVADALQSPLSERLPFAVLDAREVTVDVFDTLVTRAFLTPDAARDHLAWRLHRQLGVVGFSQHRADVEAHLRRRLTRDPTLIEIHSSLAERLALPGVNGEVLADAERSHERTVLRPRHGVLSALERAGQVSLTAFSDMYLTRRDMQAVLPDLVKTRIARWWISCETGLRKDEVASWKEFARQETLAEGRWLHVGDNEHADIQVPQLAGMMSPVHVLRPSALLDVVPGLRPLRHSQGAQAAWQEQLWRGLLANRFAAIADTAPQQLLGRPQLDARSLGYIVLGPLVLDFLLYAIDVADKRGINHLLFLSREGHFLQQAFTRLQPLHYRATRLGSSYFLASRRATMLPAMFDSSDLSCALNGTFNGSLGQLVQARLGDDALDHVASLQPALVERDVFLPEMTEDVLRWLRPSAAGLVTLAAQQRRAYRAYWTHTVGTSTPMVVDVGYAGSIQRNLARALETPLAGCYMALRATASALDDHGWAEARYFDGRCQGVDTSRSAILRNDLLVEALLAAPQGQFNGFAETSDGTFTPRFGSMELSAAGIATLSLVHEGALEFISETCETIGSDIAAVTLDPIGIQVPLQCLGDGRWDADSSLLHLATEDTFTNRGRVSAQPRG